MIFLLCLAIAAIGVALLQAASAAREAREQVRQTGEALTALRQTMRLVLDAETGQRGFLLTDDKRYLEPFERGRRELAGAIDGIADAVGADAAESQARAVTRIRRLTTAKLEELSRTVQLARDGRMADALAIVRTDEGQSLMEQIRAHITSLEQDETRILATALAHAETVEGRTPPIVGGLVLATLALAAFTFWQERRWVEAEARAAHAHELDRARHRAELLRREINHRVKNLFAVISSIVSISAREATGKDELARSVRERIGALALAHSVSQGDRPTDMVGLAGLVEATLRPYAHADGANGAARMTMEGPPVRLPARFLTPIGLILHELATNAVKHGALSVESGRVRVEWSLEVPDAGGVAQVRLTWSEEGGPAMAPHAPGAGFGTRLLQASTRQIDGTLDMRPSRTGLTVQLVFPQPAADIAMEADEPTGAAYG